MLVDYPNQFVPCDLNAGINGKASESCVCLNSCREAELFPAVPG